MLKIQPCLQILRFIIFAPKMKTQEILIARPSNAVEVNTLKAFLKALNIKFEIAKESPYRAEFVAKIEKSRRDYKAGRGKVITVSELEKLWK